MARTPDKCRTAMIQEAISASTNGIVTRQDLVHVCRKFGKSESYLNFMMSNAAGRGQYDITSFMNEDVVTTRVHNDAPVVTVETDEDIITRQRKRFRTLDRMVEGVISGSVRSFIVSGPAGVGKTYTIESALEDACREERIQYTPVKGFIKASGLYKMLWENREANQVILIDDSDSAFSDEQALNILKAALDSSKKRVVSWRSEKVFVDELGDAIPNSFDYRGSIIFITNLNFEKMINQGKSLAPHFAALVSRSFYLDLSIHSQREQMLRVFDVLDNSMMLDDLCVSHDKAIVIKTFIANNVNRMREISLRIVVKLARLLAFTQSNEDFVEMAEATCLRNN